MASFATDYVVSHCLDHLELRLSAHGIPGIFLPEELQLLGNIAELWGLTEGEYDVTVCIAPQKNLGAVHERNGKS